MSNLDILKCDVTLLDASNKVKDSMPHDSLYYALLDWSDQHQDVRQEYIKKIDKYIVSYGDRYGNYVEEEFTSSRYDDPYKAARSFYMIHKDDSEIIELRRAAHPYIGRSKVLMTQDNT